MLYTHIDRKHENIEYFIQYLKRGWFRNCITIYWTQQRELVWMSVYREHSKDLNFLLFFSLRESIAIHWSTSWIISKLYISTGAHEIRFNPDAKLQIIRRDLWRSIECYFYRLNVEYTCIVSLSSLYCHSSQFSLY